MGKVCPRVTNKLAPRTPSGRLPRQRLGSARLGRWTPGPGCWKTGTAGRRGISRGAALDEASAKPWKRRYCLLGFDSSSSHYSDDLQRSASEKCEPFVSFC